MNQIRKKMYAPRLTKRFKFMPDMLDWALDLVTFGWWVRYQCYEKYMTCHYSNENKK